MFVTSVILLLVALLTDGYIWFNFLRGGSALWSVLHWLPTAALVLVIALAAAGVAHDGAFRAASTANPHVCVELWLPV